jgi:hypothetical protein
VKVKKNYWAWIVVLLVIAVIGYWYYFVVPEFAAPFTAEELVEQADQTDQAIESMAADDGVVDLEDEIPEVAE